MREQIITFFSQTSSVEVGHFLSRAYTQEFLAHFLNIEPEEDSQNKQELLDFFCESAIKIFLKYADISVDRKKLSMDCEAIIRNCYPEDSADAEYSGAIKKIASWIILHDAEKAIAQYEKETSCTVAQYKEDMMNTLNAYDKDAAKMHLKSNPWMFLNSLKPNKEIITRQSAHSQNLIIAIKTTLSRQDSTDETKANQIRRLLTLNPAGKRLTRILQENNLLSAETNSLRRMSFR